MRKRQWILIITAVLLCLACLAAAEETWVCPDCGAENAKNFCVKCGSPRPDLTNDPAAEPDTVIVSEPFTAPRPAGRTGKIAMVCTSDISDNGWGTACYNAVCEATQKTGWEFGFSDNLRYSAYYEVICTYCSLGYDIIFATGNDYTDAVLYAAEEYPDVCFVLLNGHPSTAEMAKNHNIVILTPDPQPDGGVPEALIALMA